jgi:hypothetical protein
VTAEILSAPLSGGQSDDEEMRLVRNARKIALLAMGLAYRKFQAELEHQQELLMVIADIVMDVFAMESALLRSRKTSSGADLCSVLLRDGMARIEVGARTALAACSAGDELRTNMAVLRKFARYDPVDGVALRRRIADRLLAAGRYVT